MCYCRTGGVFLLSKYKLKWGKKYKRIIIKKMDPLNEQSTDRNNEKITIMIFWTFNAHTTETALMCNSTPCNFWSELTSRETKTILLVTDYKSNGCSDFSSTLCKPDCCIILCEIWQTLPPPSPHLPVLLIPCPAPPPFHISWDPLHGQPEPEKKSTSRCHCHCNLCGQQHTAKNDLCMTLH